MIIYLSLFVAIIGAFMYAFCTPKPAELGRIMFFCGLLAFLLTSLGPMVSLLRR